MRLHKFEEGKLSVLECTAFPKQQCKCSLKLIFFIIMQKKLNNVSRLEVKGYLRDQISSWQHFGSSLSLQSKADHHQLLIHHLQ